MINFVCNHKYGGIVEAHIKSVGLTASVSNKSLPNCINVHQFTEKWYREKTGYEGISVLLCHGLADKNYRDNSDYDFTIVPGPRWVKKLVALGHKREKLLVAGYPKLEYHSRKLTDQIVYAPTHDGTPQVSSLNRFDVPSTWIKSVHPWNGDKVSDLSQAGVVIADSGSTIYEAWAMDKPVVLTSWLVADAVSRHNPCSLEEEIYQRRIGYHVDDPADLQATVELALRCGITTKEQEFVETILPRELREHPTVAQELRRLAWTYL